MTDIHTRIRGKVWKFGDSIDTNQLASAGFQSSGALSENLKASCLRALRPEFPDLVSAGDILVAGRNFGCGSSRQSAVQALQACGIAAVLAESVARIHMRNSIALALPTFVVPGISGFATEGDEVEIDYAVGMVRKISTRETLQLARFPETVEQIYRLGGILQVVAAKLADEGVTP